ncbi:MAG: hypothetical protein WDZ83_13485 [Rhizobiaceae bacterium]
MYKLLAASALSLALLSGTAIAQVSVDGGASVDVGDTSASGSASGSADSGDVNADGTLKLGAAANVDDEVDADADASATADADVEADTDGLDTEATAAVGADAEINAVLDGFGDDANAFFTDESRTEIRSEAEIQAAFNALTEEQQASLLTICGEASASGAGTSGSAGICAAIEAM